MLFDHHCKRWSLPDSKVHGANMGPIWGRQGPDGPHVSPMNFAVWAGKLKHLNASNADPTVYLSQHSIYNMV